MNETSATAGNSAVAASTSSTIDTTSLLTTVHLIWLAIFAAAIVIGILYGARLKHRRVKAERQVVEHAEEAGVEQQAPAAKPDAPATAASTVPAPPSAPANQGGNDAADGPVTQLKGLGPKVATRLSELGITNVGQLAALDDDGARALDDQLGAFKGRLARDRWIEQARFLAAGDKAGFEAVFGKL